MTLSKEQIEDDPKTKYLKWFWIWERDLLEMARRHPAWRDLAHELGFRDAKIDSPWTFPDEGRHIKYMENPWYSEKNSTAPQLSSTATSPMVVSKLRPRWFKTIWKKFSSLWSLS